MRLRSGKATIVLSDTARLGSQLRRTLDLLKIKGRVVCILEPIEAPETSCLQLGRHLIALITGAYAAVLGAGKGGTEFLGAAIELTDAAAGNHKIKLIVGDVAAGVGGLDDHGLPRDGAGCERESVWC